MYSKEEKLQQINAISVISPFHYPDTPVPQSNTSIILLRFFYNYTAIMYKIIPAQLDWLLSTFAGLDSTELAESPGSRRWPLFKAILPF